MTVHKLFDQYAHRYDVHTPPSHYQHDHQLVIELASQFEAPCRLLDVGCGTGVLLEKARNAGIEARGLDSAPAMIDAARRRVPADAARVERMQDLAERAQYELIVCLSWSIHYCADEQELASVLHRMHAALVPGGCVLLQVAHGPNISEQWVEDIEVGPTGLPHDVVLRFRFTPSGDGSRCLLADYAYRCTSNGENFSEQHQLECADAIEIARLTEEAGFETVQLWNSWRRDVLSTSGSPFIYAAKPR